MPASAPRLVLVTGASSGIGRATAHAAAVRGHHVALLARSAGPLQDAADECLARGAASATVLAVDIRDGDAVVAAVATLTGERGPVEVVVHSAGVAAYGRLEQIPSEVFAAVLDTNVHGTANVLKAVLPGMRERDAGAVFVVGSLLGDITVPMMSPYVTSKWAVRGLVHIVRQENRDRRGITFTLVTPGGVDTPIYYEGATYSGHAGMPPPPVYSPQAAGRKIVSRFDRPPRRLDIGVANPLMRFGFLVLPAVWDTVIGPAFDLLARERRSAPAGPGNVLDAHPAGQRLRGRHAQLSRR